MASRTSVTLFCKDKLVSTNVTVNMNFDSGLFTGRSEAVLSRNLILWFNALLETTKNNTLGSEVKDQQKTESNTNTMSNIDLIFGMLGDFVPKSNIHNAKT